MRSILGAPAGFDALASAGRAVCAKPRADTHDIDTAMNNEGQNRMKISTPQVAGTAVPNAAKIRSCTASEAAA
jgi:hypothetical protein